MAQAVYILTDADFAKLRLLIKEDPHRSGALTPRNEDERRVFENAHRFYNYNVESWIIDCKNGKA